MCNQYGVPNLPHDQEPIIVAKFQTYNGSWGWSFICIKRGDLIS
jgi:hypothetical protein